MEQWDALHATLIYEDLELRETISEDSESWKQNPYVKGLRSPFLLKVCLTFPTSIAALCCKHTLFNHPALVPNTYIPPLDDPVLF